MAISRSRSPRPAPTCWRRAEKPAMPTVSPCPMMMPSSGMIRPMPRPSSAAPARPSTTTAGTSRSSPPPSARRSIGKAGGNQRHDVPWPPRRLHWPADPARSRGCLRHPTIKSSANLAAPSKIHDDDRASATDRDRGRSAGRRQAPRMADLRGPVEMAKQPGRVANMLQAKRAIAEAIVAVQPVDRLAVSPAMMVEDRHVGHVLDRNAQLSNARTR